MGLLTSMLEKILMAILKAVLSAIGKVLKNGLSTVDLLHIVSNSKKDFSTSHIKLYEDIKRVADELDLPNIDELNYYDILYIIDNVIEETKNREYENFYGELQVNKKREYRDYNLINGDRVIDEYITVVFDKAYKAYMTRKRNVNYKMEAMLGKCVSDKLIERHNRFKNDLESNITTSMRNIGSSMGIIFSFFIKGETAKITVVGFDGAADAKAIVKDIFKSTMDLDTDESYHMCGEYNGDDYSYFINKNIIGKKLVIDLSSMQTLFSGVTSAISVTITLLQKHKVCLSYEVIVHPNDVEYFDNSVTILNVTDTSMDNYVKLTEKRK